MANGSPGKNLLGFTGAAVVGFEWNRFSADLGVEGRAGVEVAMQNQEFGSHGF